MLREENAPVYSGNRKGNTDHAMPQEVVQLLCLSFELICCLALCSAQLYLAFLTHFQTIGVNSFQAGLNLSIWLGAVCGLSRSKLSDPPECWIFSNMQQESDLNAFNHMYMKQKSWSLLHAVHLFQALSEFHSWG